MKNALHSGSKSNLCRGEIVIPEQYIAHLKPFQIEGIRFLHEHYLMNENAILNDDENLGKTVQAILFVSAIRPTNCLIVCNENNVDHWKFHIKKWSTCSVAEYEKNGRRHNFCISSMNSNFNLKESNWEIVIVDDIHTDNVKLLQKLNCEYKIWLSKENFNVHIGNLFKILNWISSDRLLSRKEFDNNFMPIGDDVISNWKKWQHLTLYSRRWLLRRTRSMVRDDLPFKILEDEKVNNASITDEHKQASDSFLTLIEDEKVNIASITDEHKQASDSSLTLIENEMMDVVEIFDSSGSSDHCSPFHRSQFTVARTVDEQQASCSKKIDENEGKRNKSLNLLPSGRNQSFLQEDDCTIINFTCEKKEFKMLDSLLFAHRRTLS